MNNRRTLLATAAGAAITSSIHHRAGAAPRVGFLTKPLGLQLYSLRHIMEGSIEAGLHKARSLGFKVVEGGVFKDHTVDESRALLQKAGLTMASVFNGFKAWDEDAPKVIATTQAVNPP